MARSFGLNRHKRMPCSCGQAHLIALFVRETYDEWALPIDVMAFKDCDQIADFLDDLPEDVRDTHFAEVMSASKHHHERWIKNFPKQREAGDES